MRENFKNHGNEEMSCRRNNCRSAILDNCDELLNLLILLSMVRMQRSLLIVTILVTMEALRSHKKVQSSNSRVSIDSGYNLFTCSLMSIILHAGQNTM